jgi:hypothetical protein
MEHRIILEKFKARDVNNNTWTIQRGSIGEVRGESRAMQLVFFNNGVEVCFALRKARHTAVLKDAIDFANIIRDRMIMPRFNESLFTAKELLVFDEWVGSEIFVIEVADYARDFHILENSERTSLKPPQLESIMTPLMRRCIENEYYELCARLCRLAEEYRVAHQPLYTRKKMLAVCSGYGWLLNFGKEKVMC